MTDDAGRYHDGYTNLGWDGLRYPVSLQNEQRMNDDELIRIARITAAFLDSRDRHFYADKVREMARRLGTKLEVT